MQPFDFKDLYVLELGLLLGAEKQYQHVLPSIAEASETRELAVLLMGHLAETQGHIERLEAIFDHLEEPPREMACPVMAGLVATARWPIENVHRGPVLDAALICTCQKIAHQEMAVYGTLRAFAKSLGLFYHAKLLHHSLEEASTVNGALTELAVDRVNSMALGSWLTTAEK